MVEPVPPIARSDSSPEARLSTFTTKYSEMFKALGLLDYEKQIVASHPRYLYEEDLLIFLYAGINISDLFLAPHDDTELETWFYNDANKDYAYEYHKTFLKMLNSIDTPQSHWLLKTPLHTFYLDTLLRHYPTASLIMSHRRLDEVLPSSVRIFIAATMDYFNNSSTDTVTNKKKVVERGLKFIDIAIDRLLKFRHANQHARTFDLLYEDLMTKPIDTVRRIYEYFGLTWSEDFEQAMIKWLHENPQGKQGRNTYTLEEFGLT
ncbi:unnamed protein product [Rotaria sordida]|uniref:Sulfotransferase n=1 Tax=Rotaria sordida TaxID=392033 RepID=A0A815BBA7_9BILA|nr:unnamed protein product [Rotaria sordida]CAF4096979.1 unnamed protein product [Rotaria sordida]